MRRAAALLLLALSLGGCGDDDPLPEQDLLLRISAGADAVDLGAAFPLTVLRVWSQDLVPAPWSEGALAPLTVRLEGTQRREDGRRVAETLRYRAYAFTPKDVLVPPAVFRVRPRDGGPQRETRSEALRLQVRRTLDPKQPGPPELPEVVVPPPPARWPWGLALLLLLALAALGRRTLRRRRRAQRPPAAPVAAAPPPHARALLQLDAIAARAGANGQARREDVTETADVLRDYVSERFALRAAVKTTTELLAALAAAGAAPGPARRALAGVLGPCDVVKFAARVPTAGERDEVIAAARAFVRATGSEAS